MDTEIVYRFLNHPRRTLIATAVAIFVALFTVLPAWDYYDEAANDVRSLEDELAGVKLTVANLSPLRRRVQELTQQTEDGHQMIDSEQAELYREHVQRIAHGFHCQTRRLTLSDPMTRAWGKDDDPFNASAPPKSEKSHYKLESRQLRLSADGSLSNLTKLVIALTRLNRFAAPTSMTLQSERRDGDLRLDVDISLFNIVESID